MTTADTKPCLEDNEHRATQRHTTLECPANDDLREALTTNPPPHKEHDMTAITETQAHVLNQLSQSVQSLRTEARAVAAAAEESVARLDAFQRPGGTFSVLHNADTKLEQANAKIEAILNIGQALDLPESAVRRAFEATERVSTFFTAGDDFGSEA